MDETVSRFHAEFGTNSTGFWLKDLGSTTGTFVKLTSPVTLNSNCVVEMGLNQFIIQKTDPTLEIEIIEGPNEGNHFSFEKKDTAINIGRGALADICFSEDMHLSSMHAKIIYQNSIFILKDLGSTNG